MTKRTLVLLTNLVLILVLCTGSVHSQSRESLRNDFGIELLGKAALYSFSYQYLATPAVGLQIGMGALGGSSTDGSVLFVPVGGKLYFAPKDASPYVTGGFVYLSGTSDAGPIDSKTYGYAGAGFEMRSISGFLFRGTAYALISGGEFFVWPGLHIGYAF